MKALGRLFFAAAVLFAAGLNAAEIEGVRLDDSVTSAGQALALNGFGLRTRIVFKVYVAALYLPAKTQDANAAIAMPGAKRMTMVMLRDVGADQFAGALAASLRNNVPEPQLKRLDPEIAELMTRIHQVGEARKGMKIELDYAPTSGTMLKINGAAHGAPIRGEDFFRALLLTWLGEKPAQGELKKALLGH
ncbi:MAG: chalcone isomerase family protein [Betaproteobacteria bacterium]|nr:chalcone isomerase family protein [Betaproteobacteria bacterium]